MISLMQRHLPDHTQHPHETDIHATGGMQTHIPSKQTAADPRRLRPCGHWDRPVGTSRKQYARKIKLCTFTNMNSQSTNVCTDADNSQRQMVYRVCVNRDLRKYYLVSNCLCGCSSEMQRGKWGECVMFNLHKSHPI